MEDLQTLLGGSSFFKEHFEAKGDLKKNILRNHMPEIRPLIIICKSFFPGGLEFIDSWLQDYISLAVSFHLINIIKFEVVNVTVPFILPQPQCSQHVTLLTPRQTEVLHAFSQERWKSGNCVTTADFQVA